MTASPSTATGFWRATCDGIEVRLRLTPKSSRDQIEGVIETAEGRALKARVRAVPEDGKANAAAETLVARALDVPPSHVALVAGAKSRVKTFAVTGDADQLAQSIAGLTSRLDAGE